MKRLRNLLAAFAWVMLIPVTAAPALGWELQLTGNMSWYYQYFQQTGSNGFFGPYNVDLGGPTGTTAANLNYWFTGQLWTPNVVTGQNAAQSYFYVTFDPVINVNPALKLRSHIRFGQYGQPWASYYMTQDAIGTENAFADAQITTFWATASLPWGTFGIGKRPWKFGTGLQYDGSDGLSTESMVLNVPYGPFDFGLAFYPMRPARRGRIIPIDPYNLIVPQYYNSADRSGLISNDLLLYMTYNSGPLQIGALAAYGSYHVGPEGQAIRPTLTSTAAAAPYLAQDSYYFHGTVFEKYNNGRFFFNAELAWLHWKDWLSGSGALDPVYGATNPMTSFPRTRHTEQWRYMLEAGAFAGPAKVTFLNAWTPGPDRRNSNLYDRQPAAFVWHQTFDSMLSNHCVFRPYSFILSYNYGGGFNAYDLSANGYMRDALILATRLDYAVASNLNVYGTFFWAQRTSNGYGWACIAPDDPGVGLPPTGSGIAYSGSPQFVQSPNDGFLQFAVNGAPGSPNIPDTSLGWEVDAGVDWQLLEGYTLGFLIGYWQPGKWFNYACIDRSMPGWNVPGPGNFWGTRPDRVLDAVISGQFLLNFSF